MTQFICIAIAITSILGFNNAELVNKLILDPYMAHKKNQLYRLISCAFVHADVPHLAFNLIAFLFLRTVSRNVF
ncbi:MAG: rhomboid family intramembrane serine protease [Bacteroidetes bacterium]|nr:rhomboid family intramembrane serine protease [Bacteroidota bacterium]